MNHYTLYDLSSGEITGTGSTNAPQADIPTNGAGLLWDARLDKSLHFVAGGLALTYTDAQRAAKAERPGHWAQWSNASMQWLDPRTLAQLQAAKWEEIKRAREAAFIAPLITPFGVFQADEEGQRDIERAVLLANNLAALGYPVAIDFTLADNSIRVMDALAMVQVGLLLGGRVQLIRAQATALRGQIEAAATPAQIQALTWNPDA